MFCSFAAICITSTLKTQYIQISMYLLLSRRTFLLLITVLDLDSSFYGPF